MLKQFQVVPLRAVAETDILQQIYIADKNNFLEIISKNRLIGRTLHLEAQRVGGAVT